MAVNENSSLRSLQLSVELCSLFAKDDSEHAKIELANIMKHHFQAGESVVLYGKKERGFRLFKAGARRAKNTGGEFTIEGLRFDGPAPGITLFGPWAFPGTKKNIPCWIAFNMYNTRFSNAYILLGREKPWDNEQEKIILAETGKVIAPIIEIRTRKRQAEEEQQRTEKLLQDERNRLFTLINTSPDMIYECSSQDEIISINRSGAESLGYGAPENLIGKKLSSLAAVKKDRAALLRELKKNNRVTNFDITYLHKSGARIFCVESATVIKNKKGRIIEYQGIVTDITKHIKIEDKLKKTNQALETANAKLKQSQAMVIQQEKLASIGLLAAGIAHEINNPLSYLKSNHGTIKKSVRDIGESIKTIGPALTSSSENEYIISHLSRSSGKIKEMEEIFAESDDGFQRIIKIVNDLTIFARSDTRDNFEPYDVNKGIENTLALAAAQIKKVARVEKSLGTIPLVLAKGGEINQIILNILVNAVQAIADQHREEKGLISISTRRSGNYVRIRIKDDGPGIAEEHQTRIFDPFFTTKEPGQGTGLGLSISCEIIGTKHNGRMWFESEEGRGTTFVIDLPINTPGKGRGNEKSGPEKGAACGIPGKRSNIVDIGT